MHLGDEGKATRLNALDDVHLPQRLRPVELLGVHPPHEFLQLIERTGFGKARVPDVILEIEVLVVYPHGMALDGNERQPLAVPRDQMELRCDVPADAIDVDPPVVAQHRTGIEQRDSRDMHVRCPGLDGKK